MRRQSSILLPAFNGRYARVRYAATAAEQKPRPVDDNLPAPNLSEWARPEHSPPPKVHKERRSDFSGQWNRTQSLNSVPSSSKSLSQTHWADSSVKHSSNHTSPRAVNIKNRSEVYAPDLVNRRAHRSNGSASQGTEINFDDHPRASDVRKWSHPLSKPLPPPAVPPLSAYSDALHSQRFARRNPATAHWARVLQRSKDPPPNKWSRSRDAQTAASHVSDVASSPRFDRGFPPHIQKLDRRTSPRNDTLRQSATTTVHARFDRDAAPHSTSLGREVAPHHQGVESDHNFVQDFDLPSPQDQLGSMRRAVDSEREAGRKDRRDSFKSRGSIVSRIHERVAIPGQSKLGSATRAKGIAHRVKNMKPKELKRSADVFIPTTISVGQLSRLLNVKLDRLQKKMVEAGMAEETSYDYVLTSDYASLLVEEFGRNPVVNDEAAFDIYPSPAHRNPTSLPHRPPIITIMGHVDHGKTTLLDTLRSSAVAKGEAGGITQHIGAFSVPVPDAQGSANAKTITFLDTPGHAAFSAMRARGAGVTDIVVLVVAADDGVMPQTKEVIELVKKDVGQVGVVVAINKVDKPGADVDTVQKALLVEGIQLETFGGDVPSVEVSGLTGHGLPTLVETLSVMAELQDLRAEMDGSVHGHVLESKVLKGLGPVATVLILRGCLKPGAHIIGGTKHAKVRNMTDPSGSTVKAAYPGMAVTVSGWKELPDAGDEVLQGTESDIKKAIANRLRKAQVEAELVDVEAINAQRRRDREVRVAEEQGVEAAPSNGPKELRVVIKGDVSGSVEAVTGAIQGIGNHEALLKVVSTGVGDVSESDVMMAKAVNGMVVAFSVNTPRPVEVLATQNNVPIFSSAIIYRIMDEMKARVISLLPVIIEKKVTGEATVLQLFDVHLKGNQTKRVAGCRVVNGLVEKAKRARVVRNSVTLHEGSLHTLRQMKKDITEARKGMECGLSLELFDDLREGDLVQIFQEIERPGVL